MIRECYVGNDAGTGNMRCDKIVVIMSGLDTIVRKHNWEAGTSVPSEVAIRPFPGNSKDEENE